MTYVYEELDATTVVKGIIPERTNIETMMN